MSAAIPYERNEPANIRPSFIASEEAILLASAEVLYLRIVQELPAKEAARILNVPVGTVKARLHRARGKLFRYTQSICHASRGRRQ
jgi:predicted DNA-binding protein (UPF0251 family)